MGLECPFELELVKRLQNRAQFFWSTVQAWRKDKALLKCIHILKAMAPVYANVPSFSCRWSSFVLCVSVCPPTKKQETTVSK